MSYKMIVLDLDGTLTNSKKEITAHTKATLQKAQEQGVKVVLASGRPINGVLPIAKELELEKYGSYVLAFNGGQIVNCKTGEMIFQRTLPAEMIPQLIQFARENKVDFLTYKSEKILTNNPNSPYGKIESSINKMPLIYVENPIETITFPIPKMLMLGEGEYMAKVEPKIQEKTHGLLSIFRSEPFFLEIMPKGIDKAASLERLLEHTGIAREEMIACGDGFNDLSMIRFAGLGVAMENAQAIVKEEADYITSSNDEDGVAKVVEKFIF